MKRLYIVLALLAVMIFGSLAIETASAQNANSSTTMNSNMGMGRRMRRHRRHWRHRMHRRARRATGNANM